MQITTPSVHVSSPGARRAGAAGFTLVELLVVIAIIGVMVGLLLPAVQAAREAARRSQCTNNLKQLALAAHNYESTYKVLPPRQIGTGILWGDGRDNVNSNTRRMSGWVSLLPFIEQQPLYDMISAPLTVGDVVYPAWGPYLNSNSHAYPPWREQIQSLLCPSDGNIGNKGANDTGRNSYRFSSGDSIHRTWSMGANSRGAFALDNGYSFSAISDGTSNTIFFSERLFGQDQLFIKQGMATQVIEHSTSPVVPLPCQTAVDPADPRTYQGNVVNWSGRRWANGLNVYNCFTTVFPPNGVACTSNTNTETSNVVLPPSSNHPGGVVAAFGDGSVQFITENIDTGDLSLPERPGAGGGMSPYGVWGALGSKAGGEQASMDF